MLISIVVFFCVFIIIVLVLSSIKHFLRNEILLEVFFYKISEKWCLLKLGSHPMIVCFITEKETIYFKKIKNSLQCWKRNLSKYINIKSNETVCLINFATLFRDRDFERHTLVVNRKNTNYILEDLLTLAFVGIWNKQKDQNKEK